MRKWILVVGLLVAALFVPFAQAGAPTGGRAGRAELRFMQGMIDHHQMALDMANDCLAKATDETLKAMCQGIIDAQTAEIEQMQGWLLAWYNVQYAPVAMADMGGEMDDHSGHRMEGTPYTDPPMMMGMMAGLNRVEGTAYDIAWTESMIDHHDDAIHMAERLLERLGDEGHAELKELAQAIIDAQSAEVEAFETLLTELAAS
jgi:uncharacterized protein (DUF305 family)